MNLAGEPIVVKAQLSPPAGPALPGGFDFGRHAYFVGIGAVGYTMAMPVRDADAGEPPLTLRISAAVERLRRDRCARRSGAERRDGGDRQGVGDG